MNFLEIFNNLQDKETPKSIDDRVLIVDGTNAFIRCWSAMPAMSENGEHVGGIIGLLRSIGVNIRDFSPTRCILVFDGKGGSVRRRKIYPEYKATRKKDTSKLTREEFKSWEDERISMRRQMMRVIEYFQVLPVQIVCIDNIEADDTIAYIASNYYSNHQNKIRIVSTDRDFLQLTSDKVEIYSPVKKKLYNKENLKEEYGFLSSNYLLYRTIDGDMGDNIPGIKGVGAKTLLKEFPELSTEDKDLYYLLEKSEKECKLKKKKIFELLLENKEVLERNYKLMQLHDPDISGNAKLKICDIIQSPVTKLDKLAFRRLLIEDGLQGHFKNYDNWINMTFNSLVSWT